MKLSPFNSKASPKRGSVLVGVLISLAILSASVMAIVGTANYNTRLTRDQLEYESAYTAAISGIHTGRAMLNYPTLLITMLNRASLGEDVSGLLNPSNVTNTLEGASGMVADVLNGDLGGLTAGLDPLTGGLLSRHGLGNTLHKLSDGRLVLIDVPTVNGKIIGFANESQGVANSQNLFSGKSTTGFDAYVDRLRITTVPLNSLTGILSLKDVALIIEARGVVDHGGRRKERIIQERVLIYPDIKVAPLVNAAASLVSGGNLNAVGNANFNFAWGSILAKGNIDLTNGLTFIPSLLGNSKLRAETGFRGAGVAIPGLNDLGQPMTEKWLKWQAGSEGSLKISEQRLRIPLLGDLLVGLLNGSNPPTDLFSELKNGGIVLNLLNLLTPNKFDLTGAYNATLATGQTKGLFEVDDQGKAINGALVQKSDSVDETVDRFIDTTMNYTSWKDRAIKRNKYLKPITNGQANSPVFANSFDQPLYLNESGQLTTEADGNTPVVTLNQFSMADKIAAANGNVHRTDSQRVDDSFLFIDYVGGSEQNPGPLREHFLGDGFLFKGVLYICGNVKLGDASSNPPIFTKSPDQYTADPDGINRGQALSNVVLDGILFSEGTVTSVGNAVIYGTLGTKGSLNSNTSPKLFYNLSNSLGRLRLPIKSDLKAQVVLGRVYEVNNWAN